MRVARLLSLIVVAGVIVTGCELSRNRASGTQTAAVGENGVVADKPFASGGNIAIQLDGGEYEIRPSADDHIRVTLSGNSAGTKVGVNADGTHAEVKVQDTPHNNFKATIEVPKVADLSVRLTGGDLRLKPIAGNKDVESYGGDVRIAVGDPDQYASVDASVKAGDITATPFGGSKSGLLQHFTWTGRGKYTLRASLGAGDLRLTTE